MLIGGDRWHLFWTFALVCIAHGLYCATSIGVTVNGCDVAALLLRVAVCKWSCTACSKWLLLQDALALTRSLPLSDSFLGPLGLGIFLVL